MPAVPLIGGFYQARSLIADAQACTNLYPEPNPEGSDQPMICYPTPGLTLLVSGEDTQEAEVRGLYYTTSEQLIVVIGTKVYYFNSAFAPTELGTIASSSGQVKMADNGLFVMIVDGTSAGYTQDMSDMTASGFATMSDPAFYGGNYVAYQDTFFILNKPNTNVFYISDSNSITFDALNIGVKAGAPDNISALASVKRELWLLGKVKATEIWYNSGAAGFPFEIFPGAYLDLKTLAPYSLANGESELLWIGGLSQGVVGVYEGKNYAYQEIDTYAIGNQLITYTAFSDAIGMFYEQGKHRYYMLTFPTQDITWVYDLSTKLWHRRGWTDEDGVMHRHRANCMTFAYDKIVVGDWENGNIYYFDLANYTDNDDPIVRRRGVPHIVGGSSLIEYNKLIASMDCGNIQGTLTSDVPPKVNLRYSDDWGRTWKPTPAQSIGNTGQYNIFPTWTQLGQSRARTFELFWSADCFSALQGLWIDAKGNQPT